MQWMKAWLDSWPSPPSAKRAPKAKTRGAAKTDRGIAERIERLEVRITELEAERGRQN
jgi:hypothetical protein